VHPAYVRWIHEAGLAPWSAPPAVEELPAGEAALMALAAAASLASAVWDALLQREGEGEGEGAGAGAGAGEGEGEGEGAGAGEGEGERDPSTQAGPPHDELVLGADRRQR
jgi:hypothetical protein